MQAVVKKLSTPFFITACIHDSKKATNTAEMMSVLCVDIFWAVNASSGEKVVYSFRYRPGPGQVGREVFDIVLKVGQGREQIFTWKHRSRVKFWQDFGVVGTPATDSVGSIRVYAHSSETRSSAPTPVMLRQREQREGNICSLTWGTSLVSLLLTL